MPATPHVSGLLTNISIGYRSPEFVLEGAAPTVPVAHKTDPFLKFVKEDWTRNEAGERDRLGMYPRIDFRTSTDTFSCTSKGLGIRVDDELVEDADPALDPDTNATLITTDGALRRYELDVASIFLDSTWTAGSAVDATGQEWNLPDGGSIVSHIETVTQAIHDSISRIPNTGIMGWKTLRAVRTNPVYREFIKGRTGLQTFELQDLIEFTGIPRWIIVPGVYNSAVKTAAGTGFTAAQIWGDKVWIGYIAPTASRMLPSAVYTFKFRGLRTKVYREEAVGAKVVETDQCYALKQTAADAGQLIENVL